MIVIDLNAAIEGGRTMSEDATQLKMVGIQRRSFIGGSDARVIMGNDEAALIRLWQEKRGEVGPEDLVGQLDCPAWVRDRGAEPYLVRA